MLRLVIDSYVTILKGLLILATAGAISAVTVDKAAKSAGQSVRTGLVGLMRTGGSSYARTSTRFQSAVLPQR